MLVAGADFTTVPEFEEFADRVRGNGTEVDMHVYDGAPHSFFDRSFAEWRDACSDAWRRDPRLHGGPRLTGDAAARGEGSMVPAVVDVAWLRARLAGPADQRPVLADVRWYLDGRSGRAAYDAGHLPGAVFVDLDRWLAAPPTPEQGRHPLPSPEIFAQGVASLGIGDGTLVVGYDDEGGVTAARLVWMLRVTGHDAALLDGGVQAWDGPLETATVHPSPARFTAQPWPADRLATLADATHPDLVVLDARQPERYRGEVEPVDPRAGHVPGARSLPCRENLLVDKRFRAVQELRRRLADVGVRDAADAARVVSYCGSGVNACHTLLVMEHAGLGQGRLYPGSWSQYSADPSRPAATGPDPGRDAGQLPEP